jgi:hypothetical protein
MYHAATTAFGAPTPTGQHQQQQLYAPYQQQQMPTGPLNLTPMGGAAAPPALYAPHPQQQQQQTNGLMLPVFTPSPTGAQAAAASAQGYAFPPQQQQQQQQQPASTATTPAAGAGAGVLFYPSAGDVRIAISGAAGAPPPVLQEADVRAIVGASGVAAATEAMTIAMAPGGGEAIVRLQRPGMGPAIAQALNGRWTAQQQLLTLAVL